MLPYIDFRSFFWFPVPNHQVGSDDRVRKALAKRFEHILRRLGALGIGRSTGLRTGGG